MKCVGPGEQVDGDSYEPGPDEWSTEGGEQHSNYTKAVLRPGLRASLIFERIEQVGTYGRLRVLALP